MTFDQRPPHVSPLRLFTVPCVVALAFAALTVVVSLVARMPLRDAIGSERASYLMVPALIAGAIFVDIAARVIMRRPRVRDTGLVTVDVLRTRWTVTRIAVVVGGALSAYVVYLSYRNLKVFLPHLRDRLADHTLTAVDQWLGAGHAPSAVLQQLLGTGLSSEILSSTYMAFMMFVPLSLVVALVWSSELVQGVGYACALCFNWIIGMATYYAVPSVGPIYAEPFRFEDLPVTSVSELQHSLYQDRLEILAQPHTTDAVHGIAAFASLHVSIVLTAVLFAHRMGFPRLLCRLLWGYFGLTVLSTIYFGWHYLLDDIAGVGVALLSVWLASVAVGGSTRHSTRSQRVATPVRERVTSMAPSWRSRQKLG